MRDVSCKGSLNAAIDSATCTLNVLPITFTHAVDNEYGGQATTIKFGRIFKVSLHGFVASIIRSFDNSLTAEPPEKTRCYLSCFGSG